jgi:selenide,water dikinase
MMNREPPILADLVFLGGGHAQVAAIKHFIMKPVPGLRLTIVTSQTRTPYSGMLPAFVEGVWQDDDIHIDLSYLARLANARLIVAPCTGIDPINKTLLFANRPALHFDILSINIGGHPDVDAIAGAGEFAIPVKPISRFQRKFSDFASRTAPARIGIIGGGAAGCELALALDRYWKNRGQTPQLTLFSRSQTLLPGMAPRAGLLMLKALHAAGVSMCLGKAVVSVEKHKLHLDDGEQHDCDACFLVTPVRPPDWLARSGLELDKDGFIAVRPTLQTRRYPFIFAAGDIASLDGFDRPKAGVFAVRAGPVLARNLRLFLYGKPATRWRPQFHYLALIGTADGEAIACRGRVAVKSSLMLTWKQWIDRRFMRQYQQITMPEPEAPRPFAGLTAPSSDDPALAAIRCMGCAAKAGRDVLSNALLSARQAAIDAGADPALIGLDHAEGDGLASDVGAVPAVPRNRRLVQSVDSVSEIISDPFLFGRIAALHALSDLYAVGARPLSALAIITLPEASVTIQTNQLTQLLSGAVIALAEHGVRLAGGHTSEGGRLTVGFSVTGHAPKPKTISARPDSCLLVLSKPIGTGIVMAGHMQGLAPAGGFDAAVSVMTQSNAAAADIFAKNHVIAATDVTGFGLARHAENLIERIGAGRCDIAMAVIPLVEGAESLARQGVASSLVGSNKAATTLHPPPPDGAIPDWYSPILFDPQTSGGLLGVFAPDDALKALAALKRTNHRAAIIGVVHQQGHGIGIVDTLRPNPEDGAV